MLLCKHGLTQHLETTCADCDRLIRDPDEFLNLDDWFLTNVSRDDRGWRDADEVTAEMVVLEDIAWSEPILLPGDKRPVTLDAVEDLMDDDRDWVGGIVGLAPEYHAVRAGLIKLGRAS